LFCALLIVREPFSLLFFLSTGRRRRLGCWFGRRSRRPEYLAGGCRCFPARFLARFPARFLTRKFVAVSNRMSLLEARMFHSTMCGAFHSVAPYSVVDKPAVLIPVKFISDNAPSIEIMKAFSTNMSAKFMASHPEESIVEVIVIHKGENAFAQTKLKVSTHPETVKHEKPPIRHENRSQRQRRPPNGGVLFPMTPKDPGGAPR
jgi:hypothetical protein